MAEYGEWNRKGATLSDATAHKEYGVSQEFIVKGIRAERLEYREGSIWGNPYLRVLRSQLEQYIAEQLGSNHLACSLSLLADAHAVRRVDLPQRAEAPWLTPAQTV